MGTTLSKGYKLPANGDRGSTFYDDLADNITLSNSHSHNGTDGEPINCKYLTKTTSTIASGSWVAVVGQTGTYRQLVTVPSGFSMDSTELKFFVNGGGEDGHQVYPSVEKVSSTTYYVYINDNTISLKVTYG